MATNDNLHQIMYTSTAVRHMGVSDLNDLLVQARDKNGRLGITGMLIYRSGSFMQLIEGSRDVLQDLFATIRADERHRNVVTLLDEKKQERDFSAWSMAFHHLGEMTPQDLPEGYLDFFSEGFNAEAFQEDSSYGKNMLLHFRKAEDI